MDFARVIFNIRVNSIKIVIAEKGVNYLIRLLDHIMTNLRCVLNNVCDPSLTEPGLHLVIPYALFVLVLIDFYCREHIVG